MTCESFDGDGCRSCMTSLLRPTQWTDPGCDRAGDENSEAARIDHLCNSTGKGPESGSQLVLLSVMAFVLPIVVSIVTVQFIEGRFGSATAAIAGLAAVGLTTAIAARIVRRFACWSAFTGGSP